MSINHFAFTAAELENHEAVCLVCGKLHPTYDTTLECCSINPELVSTAIEDGEIEFEFEIVELGNGFPAVGDYHFDHDNEGAFVVTSIGTIHTNRNRRGNTMFITAKMADYEAACETCGLDPANPEPWL